MDTQFVLAVGKLRLENQSELLEDFIKTALRLRQALNFYANPDNYIDGAPQLISLDGEATADNGDVARYALKNEPHIN